MTVVSSHIKHEPQQLKPPPGAPEVVNRNDGVDLNSNTRSTTITTQQTKLQPGAVLSLRHDENSASDLGTSAMDPCQKKSRPSSRASGTDDSISEAAGTEIGQMNSPRVSKTRRKGKDTDGRWVKRFTWSEDLHRDFVSSIFDVGVKHASPAAILEHMPNHNDITKKSIKVYLQAYRLYLTRAKKETLKRKKQRGNVEPAKMPLPPPQVKTKPILPSFVDVQKQTPNGAPMGHLIGLLSFLNRELLAQRGEQQAAANGRKQQHSSGPDKLGIQDGQQQIGKTTGYNRMDRGEPYPGKDPVAVSSHDLQTKISSNPAAGGHTNSMMSFRQSPYPNAQYSSHLQNSEGYGTQDYGRRHSYHGQPYHHNQTSHHESSAPHSGKSQSNRTGSFWSNNNPRQGRKRGRGVHGEEKKDYNEDRKVRKEKESQTVTGNARQRGKPHGSGDLSIDSSDDPWTRTVENTQHSSRSHDHSRTHNRLHKGNIMKQGTQKQGADQAAKQKGRKQASDIWFAEDQKDKLERKGVRMPKSNAETKSTREHQHDSQVKGPSRSLSIDSADEFWTRAAEDKHLFEFMNSVTPKDL